MKDWIEQTMEYWRAGGPLLAPMAILCFGIWAVFMRSREKLIQTLRECEDIVKVWTIASPGAGPSGLVESLAPFKSAVALMLRLAADDVNSGMAPVRAVAARETACLRMLRRDFTLLATLTATAPLLGLMGTVMGMIVTFEAVAAAAGHTGEWMAAGISQALITTQFGLAVALPGAFGLARLQRMLRHVQAALAACRSHAVQALTGRGRELIP